MNGIQQLFKNTQKVTAGSVKGQVFYLPSQTMFQTDNDTLKIVIIGQWTNRESSNLYNASDIAGGDYKSTNPNVNGNLIMNAERGQNTFKFIAPNELTEAISHMWEPYESVGFKAAEKAATAGRFAVEGKAFLDAGLDITDVAYKNLISKSVLGTLKSDNAMSLINDASGKGIKLFTGADVYTTRVDSPLVYKGSSRRIYEFIFQLFATGEGVGPYNGTYNEVVLPVKVLQYMSAPSQMKGNVTNKALAQVQPPAIFKIKTDPEGLFDVKRAVLKNINPLYRGPYVDGAPTSCELHLTFEEYDPLWDTSFDPSSVVSTENYGDVSEDELTQYSEDKKHEK